MSTDSEAASAAILRSALEFGLLELESVCGSAFKVMYECVLIGSCRQ